MDETRTIAKFVHETEYEDIPPGLIDDFKIFVLDAIGAAFIGSQQPWAQTIVSMVKYLGGSEEATVINQPWKTDLSRAALANGAMIGAFEAEPVTGAHSSGTVFPAVLAVCEREHLSGKAFFTALILGTEVSGRIQRTAVGLESDRGFHNPGTQGPFGAALAFGKLFNFDEQTLVNAMGIAGSSAGGLLEFVWDGANTKRIHLGRACQLGIESAMLAREGYVGPSTILEGRYGYFNAFSLPGYELERLTDGLGENWLVSTPAHKSYATHSSHQAVVNAIQEFKKEHPIVPEKLTRVSISGGPGMMEPRRGVRNATTVMGGQYSLPVAVAVSLTRDMSNPLVFNEEALQDPVVRDLAQRIELHTIGEGATPEVTIEQDGQSYVLQAHPHKGSASNRFSWDEICEKFGRYAGQVIDERRRARIIEAVADLDRSSDAAALASVLSAPE
jgi:2-methylcitrate dehydratase PrpD